MLKTRRNDRVVRVERRRRIGPAGRLKAALWESEDSETLHTSFVERLTLTIRQGSAYLRRRSPCHARGADQLHGHVDLLRGVGARKQVFVAALAIVTAEGACSRREVESASQVQNEIPRRKLAGVRPSTGPARRRHPVVDAGSDRHVGGRGRRQARRAAAVLRGCHRNRADAPPDLSPAPSSDGGLSEVDLRDAVPRPVRARSHDSLTAWSAPRPCTSPPPRGRRHTSHRRQYRALDCG